METPNAGELPRAKQQNKTEKPNALIEKARGINLFFDTNIVGKENIETIPQGKNVIIATTHIGNLDVPIVINALGTYFKNLTVTEESTHYIFRQDPFSYLGRILDPKHSFRIDYNSGKMNRRGEFHPKNFEPMKKSLEDGKPLVIAAFYKAANSSKRIELPKQTGNGAAYLGQITDNAIILPVAVDIKLNYPFRGGASNIFKLLSELTKSGHIEVDVIIGKPFAPERIEEIGRLEKLLEERQSKPLTGAELAEYLNLKSQLKKQSKIIMQRLAELLPEQKRGVWD